MFSVGFVWNSWVKWVGRIGVVVHFHYIFANCLFSDGFNSTNRILSEFKFLLQTGLHISKSQRIN